MITMSVRFVMIALGLVLTLPAQAQVKPPKPLFASDEIVSIRIEAPFSKIMRGSNKSTKPYPARLISEGQSYDITLAARGRSRRMSDVCRFAPLRVRFPDKPMTGSVFKGQKSLKLVTHCLNAKKKQHYVIKEYAAYTLMNVVTPQSLKVRMAEITYVDSKKGRELMTRMGFFIEDTDDMAKRNGQKELDVSGIKISQLDMTGAAQFALFQYMIGNLDWSMRRGAKGSDCCHNAKLIVASDKAVGMVTPIAYDFDHSGLVNAPYALPPKSARTSSVKIRQYRGLCAHNDQARHAAAVFLQKQDEIMTVMDGVPMLKGRHSDQARLYLAKFFKTLADPDKFESRIIDHCQGRKK